MGLYIYIINYMHAKVFAAIFFLPYEISLFIIYLLIFKSTLQPETSSFKYHINEVYYKVYTHLCAQLIRINHNLHLGETNLIDKIKTEYGGFK